MNYKLSKQPKRKPAKAPTRAQLVEMNEVARLAYAKAIRQAQAEHDRRLKALAQREKSSLEILVQGFKDFSWYIGKLFSSDRF